MSCICKVENIIPLSIPHLFSLITNFLVSFKINVMGNIFNAEYFRFSSSHSGNGPQGLGDIACDNSNMHLDERFLTNVQIKNKIKIFNAICMKISCSQICMQAKN